MSTEEKPPETPIEHRAARLRAAVEIPARSSVALPSSLAVQWARNADFGHRIVHESAVVSAQLVWTDESGALAREDLFQRDGNGLLNGRPLTDLAERAGELAEAKSMIDVCEIFSRILADGAEPVKE